VDPSEERRRGVYDFKKLQILRTAEAVFSEHGLEATSLRAIAKAAGYTAPAIYTYYRTKEDLYGEIIARSLDELSTSLDTVAAAARDPLKALRAVIFGYYAYYRDHSHQLDLGLYLFSGARPAGVTPEIDRDLNRRFKRGVDRIAQLYREALGVSEAEANTAAAGAIVHAFGLVIMGATKRLRVLRQDGDSMMHEYIERVLAAATAPPRRKLKDA
jgi:AcrR family transcriptional regulator